MNKEWKHRMLAGWKSKMMNHGLKLFTCPHSPGLNLVLQLPFTLGLLNPGSLTSLHAHSSPSSCNKPKSHFQGKKLPQVIQLHIVTSKLKQNYQRLFTSPVKLKAERSNNDKTLWGQKFIFNNMWEMWQLDFHFQRIFSVDQTQHLIHVAKYEFLPLQPAL